MAGIDSDRLYPLDQQRRLAAGIPTAGDLRVVTSPYGHDAFLLESAQVAPLVTEVLNVTRFGRHFLGYDRENVAQSGEGVR